MLASLIDAVFPRSCGGCRRTGDALCGACRPFVRDASTFELGGMRVVATARYAGEFRLAVLAYKRGRRDVGDALAAHLAAVVPAALVAGAVLVPVPTVAARRRSRGFDQGVRLARALGERCGAPALVVLAQRAGDAQRGRTRTQRLRAQGRFACVAPALVRGVEVVLVDDVVTTGATLADCAATLRGHGACVRGAVALAYA